VPLTIYYPRTSCRPERVLAAAAAAARGTTKRGTSFSFGGVESGRNESRGEMNFKTILPPMTWFKQLNKHQSLMIRDTTSRAILSRSSIESIDSRDEEVVSMSQFGSGGPTSSQSSSNNDTASSSNNDTASSPNGTTSSLRFSSKNHHKRHHKTLGMTRSRHHIRTDDIVMTSDRKRRNIAIHFKNASPAVMEKEEEGLSLGEIEMRTEEEEEEEWDEEKEIDEEKECDDDNDSVSVLEEHHDLRFEQKQSLMIRLNNLFVHYKIINNNAPGSQ
jgi:hypothetical protein